MASINSSIGYSAPDNIFTTTTLSFPYIDGAIFDHDSNIYMYVGLPWITKASMVDAMSVRPLIKQIKYT